MATTLVDNAQSLQSAINAANTNTSISEIVFAENAKIKLNAPVIYTGTQSLALLGNNAIIDGSAAGNFKIAEDLTAVTTDASLIFNSAANLHFSQLTIVNSASRGLLVNIPDKAKGDDISIVMNQVKIIGSALYGLHIDDNANEFDEGQMGSDIGINLVIKHSTFTNNGIGAIDFDGVRVDERGPGSIQAFITDTKIDSNGGDGIELDEAGSGDVNVTMIDVSVSNNGFYNTLDLDDGFDIDEAGDGNITATLLNLVVNNNLDEGLDFDESGDGDVLVKMHQIVAEHNSDEGIKIDEEDAGNIQTLLSNITVNNSGDDGLQLTELGEGNIQGQLIDVTITQSTKLGLKAEMWNQEDETTTSETAGSLQISRLVLLNNGKGDKPGVNNINVIEQ